MKRIACAFASVVLFTASPALATFHLMAIQEVFVGRPGDSSGPLTPDQRSQYVMMRMTNSGQTSLDINSTFIRVEDAAGNILGSFGSFTSPDGVSSGGALGCGYPPAVTLCPAVLMGTQVAKNLFTFNFDKIVTGQASRVALPLAGGRICFMSGSSIVDCVAWGSFLCTPANCPGGPNTLHSGELSANGCDTDFGTPAAALKFGFVLKRTSFSCLSKDNSADFALGFPTPVNNLGANNNVFSDADGLIDQLDCDDTNTAILWPPAEVQDVTVTQPTPGFSVISWSSQVESSGTAVSYDVVRGTLANLNGFTDAACYMADVADPFTNDATPPDPPGSGLYYLVRAQTSASCVGIYGPGASYLVLNPLCP